MVCALVEACLWRKEFLQVSWLRSCYFLRNKDVCSFIYEYIYVYLIRNGERVKVNFLGCTA